MTNDIEKKRDDEIIDVPVEPAIEEEDSWVPTPKQRYSMELFLDWTKKYTLNEIAEKTKIKRMTLYRWRRSEKYKKYLQRLSTEKLREALPLVEKALIRAADKGDVAAIKLYLEYVKDFREGFDMVFGWGEGKKP